MPYANVLVVDDVESNIYVIKGMLLPYGMKIDTASSGFEAIEKVKSGSVYDIIFMDHMMPKMDGIEATKIIREMGYTQPIVALTANALLGRAEMFLDNGFDGFVSKPIDSRELNIVLNEQIRNKKPPEVIEAARQEKSKFIKNFAPEQARALMKKELVTGVIHDVKNAIKALDELLPALNTKAADLGLYITTVHGLKSALANINETALSNTALKLENAAGNADIAVLSSETGGFIKTLKKFLDKIKSNDVNDSAEVPREVSNDDMEFLRGKLNDVKTACERLNIKDAKAALFELKERKWPQKTHDILEPAADRALVIN